MFHSISACRALAICNIRKNNKITIINKYPAGYLDKVYNSATIQEIYKKLQGLLCNSPFQPFAKILINLATEILIWLQDLLPMLSSFANILYKMVKPNKFG